MSQVQKEKPAPQEVEQAPPVKAKDLKNEEVDKATAEVEAKIDEALGDQKSIDDMIDDALETNAEEFVKNYVQRGGE